MESIRNGGAGYETYNNPSADKPSSLLDDGKPQPATSYAVPFSDKRCGDSGAWLHSRERGGTQISEQVRPSLLEWQRKAAKSSGPRKFCILLFIGTSQKTRLSGCAEECDGRVLRQNGVKAVDTTECAQEVLIEQYMTIQIESDCR